MNELKYTKEHEWLRLEDDASITMGISHFAQEQLGDVVYVELPEVGQTVIKDEDTVVIESVKAASDINIPLNGTIIEVNDELNDEPGKVNTDPTGEGWLFKIKPNDHEELLSFMDEQDYKKFLQM